jgi:threonine dehydrogenase-like Zn-dependent dehydrogenase
MPEAMVECTGSPAVLGSMHEYVCHGASISMVGWPKSPATINTIRCMQKELDLCPSRNSNNKFPEAIRLVDSGRVPVDRMITRKISLPDTEEVMKDMIDNPDKYMKVIVEV